MQGEWPERARAGAGGSGLRAGGVGRGHTHDDVECNEYNNWARRGWTGLEWTGRRRGRGYNYAYFKMGEAVVKRTSVRNRNRLNPSNIEPSPPTSCAAASSLALLPAVCSCMHSARRRPAVILPPAAGVPHNGGRGGGTKCCASDDIFYFSTTNTTDRSVECRNEYCLNVIYHASLLEHSAH